MYLLNVLTGDDCHQERHIHDLRSLLSAKGTVSIGRDPTSADIAMDSKELPAMISRNHAEIRCEGGKVCLLDRNSVNGTWCEADF
jgi:pSer/pThr/pTyr-binding forkhead associated (FHA) protein